MPGSQKYIHNNPHSLLSASEVHSQKIITKTGNPVYNSSYGIRSSSRPDLDQRREHVYSQMKRVLNLKRKCPDQSSFDENRCYNGLAQTYSFRNTSQGFFNPKKHRDHSPQASIMRQNYQSPGSYFRAPSFKNIHAYNSSGKKIIPMSRSSTSTVKNFPNSPVNVPHIHSPALNIRQTNVLPPPLNIHTTEILPPPVIHKPADYNIETHIEVDGNNDEIIRKLETMSNSQLDTNKKITELLKKSINSTPRCRLQDKFDEDERSASKGSTPSFTSPHKKQLKAAELDSLKTEIDRLRRENRLLKEGDDERLDMYRGKDRNESNEHYGLDRRQGDRFDNGPFVPEEEREMEEKTDRIRRGSSYDMQETNRRRQSGKMGRKQLEDMGLISKNQRESDNYVDSYGFGRHGEYGSFTNDTGKLGKGDRRPEEEGREYRRDHEEKHRREHEGVNDGGNTLDNGIDHGVDNGTEYRRDHGKEYGRDHEGDNGTDYRREHEKIDGGDHGKEYRDHEGDNGLEHHREQDAYLNQAHNPIDRSQIRPDRPSPMRPDEPPNHSNVDLELRKFTANLQEKDAEIERLKDKIQVLETRLNTDRSMLQGYIDDIEEYGEPSFLSKKLKNLEKENENFKSDNKELAQELKFLKNENKKNSLKFKKLKKESQSLMSIKSDLESENRSFKEKLENFSQSYHSSEEAFFKKRIKTLEIDNKKLKDSLEDQKNISREREEKLSHLKRSHQSEIEEIQSQKSEPRLSQIPEVEEMRAKSRILKSELDMQRNRNADLEKDLEQKKQMIDRENQKLFDKNKLLQAELDSLEEETNKLRRDVSDYEKWVSEGNEELNAYKQKSKKLEFIVQNLQNENNELKVENDEIKKNEKSGKFEIHSKLSKLKDDLMRAEEANAKLGSDVKRLEDKKRESKEREEKLLEEISELKSKMHEMKRSLISKESDEKGLGIKIGDLERRVKSLEDEVSGLKEEKVALNSKIERLITTKESQIREINHLKQPQADSEKQTLRSTISKLESKISSMEVEKSKEISILQEDKRALEKTAEDLQKELMKLNKKIKALSERLELAESERKKANEKALEYNRQMSEAIGMRDDISRELNKQKENNKIMVGQNSASMKERMDLKALVEQLKIEIEGLKQSIIDIEKDRNYLKSEVKVYIKSIENKDEKIKLLKAGLEKLRVKIVVQEKENEKLKKKVRKQFNPL